jgi:acetolactate synthase-1/2/3 large subunit
MLSGGGAMYLNDATVLHKKIKYICCHHEQACGYAAEAYAKMSGNVGVCIVTSGPGSTNVITPLMEAYQNSIPVLFLSSQTKLWQIGISRQFGIQEVDIIPIVDRITKYAAIVRNPLDTIKHLDMAYKELLGNRKGPVWLDIPTDIAQHVCTLY